MSTKEKRKAVKAPREILKMSSKSARKFFLKGESYCNFDLPPYFTFDPMLIEVADYLSGKPERSHRVSSIGPRKFDCINHTILHNKDGQYAWRPMQLVHPVLYVELALKLTSVENWKFLKHRFKSFRRDPRIHCMSLPVESRASKRDKAEQILTWWMEIEQRSIEYSLDYQYLAQTDITDCYGSIYTHSVSWALHGRKQAKAMQKRTQLFGNELDHLLQDINRGQTNGISQGSVLMDFVAEIVLGYADLVLSMKLKKAGINDFQILRYRDDYRVFTNHPTQGEEILKAISETMYFLGMKLHPGKTGVTSDVVRESIKKDKVTWTRSKQSAKGLQKHLLIIHDFAEKYPNSGSLIRSLSVFHRRLLRMKRPVRHASTLIAMVVDIAAKNPKVYSVAAAVVSKLIESVTDDQEKKLLMGRIERRFKKVANTGQLQIWLQRIALPVGAEMHFSEPLCDLANGKDAELWCNDWIADKKLKRMLDPKKILNKSLLQKVPSVIPADEVQLFEAYYP